MKRLDPFGSSRFCLHHPLPLRLLRKRRVQAAQKAELCFCHTVVFHAVLTVFLKIHVAVQLIDGFIVQPQRFLQSMLTVTVGILRDALIAVIVVKDLSCLGRTNFLSNAVIVCRIDDLGRFVTRGQCAHSHPRGGIDPIISS